METFGTKTCPQCGQELFSDMPVCYGCLHSFAERPSAPALPPPALPDLGDLDEVDGLDGEEAALERSGAMGEGLLLRVSTDDAQTTIAIPQPGLTIGRDASCDVVLRSRAVSKRHARVVPLSSAAIVENLGATNPAVYKGREVIETAVVHRGESFDVCGAVFTVV